jgi:hypothetical protein
LCAVHAATTSAPKTKLNRLLNPMNARFFAMSG